MIIKKKVSLEEPHKRFVAMLGFKLQRMPSYTYANADSLEKASSNIERYREIVSDPLNLLVNRVPAAGYLVENGHVILHNGNRVPSGGVGAYYSEFSEILIIDRGGTGTA